MRGGAHGRAKVESRVAVYTAVTENCRESLCDGMSMVVWYKSVDHRIDMARD